MRWSRRPRRCAVVVGQAASIGGDCFLLFHEAASGRTFGLDASGVAPALALPERFPDGMKSRGPLAIVRGWSTPGMSCTPALAACRGTICFNPQSRWPRATRSRKYWRSACPRTATRLRPIPAARRSICRRGGWFPVAVGEVLHIAGLTDFGPGRAEALPERLTEYLTVHHQGPAEADVTEGSGGVWERLHYDSSDPNHVKLTTTDSNTFGGASGYTYTLTRQPNGMTEVDVVIVREGKNLKGGYSPACSEPSERARWGRRSPPASRPSKRGAAQARRNSGRAGRRTT